MIDLAFTYLITWFDHQGKDMTLALMDLLRWPVVIVGYLILRMNTLVRYVVVPEAWPGMVHINETGPDSWCEECDHPLSVHDRGTGRCCKGATAAMLAVALVLPLPRIVRALMQRHGCKCRLRPQGR